jgi:hypothetical protein
MKRDLDIEIQRKGRRADEFSLHADPEDTATLRAALIDWLTGNGWDKGHWDKFELQARVAGEYKIRSKVRA